MTTTEASDIHCSVRTIYHTLMDMEIAVVEPKVYADTLRLGCEAILAGLAYVNTVADELWFSDEEETVLEIAHEYAKWRLETIYK